MPPGVAVDILAVQDIFDHVELGLDGRRFGSGTVTFECCQNLTSFVVFAFADEKARAVWQERT